MPVIMAFTTQQIADLANISRSRLGYWEQTGVFEPEFIERHATGPFRRIYSFRDLVSLRVIAHLRNEYGVSLGELRNVTAYIRDSSDALWSHLAIRVYANHLAFRDPETTQWMSANPTGQLLFELELAEVSEQSERAARQFMARRPETHGKISRNRNIMSNAWVIAGTRIPVQAVISLHNGGYTLRQIIDEYPSLVPADIDAALMHEEHERSVA